MLESTTILDVCSVKLITSPSPADLTWIVLVITVIILRIFHYDPYISFMGVVILLLICLKLCQTSYHLQVGVYMTDLFEFERKIMRIAADSV